MENENDILNKDILNNEVIFNLIQDIKKKEIDIVTKGKLIKLYAKKYYLSLNKVGQKLEIPKTTMHTWARAAELGTEKYEELLKNGWTTSEIQKELKNGSVDVFKQKLDQKKIDLMLEDSKSKFTEFIYKPDFSKDTPIKIRELINILNRVLMRVEK